MAVTRSASVALTALAPGPAAVARSDVRLGAPPPSSAAYSGFGCARSERLLARACSLFVPSLFLLRLRSLVKERERKTASAAAAGRCCSGGTIHQRTVGIAPLPRAKT